MFLSRFISSSSLISLLPSASVKSISFIGSTFKSNQFIKTHLPISPNSPCWSSKCEEPDNHLQLFDEITKRAGLGIHPYLNASHATSKRRGNPSVSRIIRSITTNGLDDQCRRGIHATTIKTGFTLEISIVTALIGFYSSSLHDLDSARKLFYTTPTKDLILWTAMVSACCKNGEFLMAINTFGDMMHFGIDPNCVSLMSVLLACANVGALPYGKQTHGLSVRRGFHLKAILQNSLVDMYSKCGRLDAATLVFNGIKEKDVISWRNLIFGCTSNGQPRKALLLFSSMRKSHIESDETTVRNVIGVCFPIRDQEIGLELHCYVIKNGLLCSTSLGTSLLNMYADFKDVEAARTIFDQLRDKDIIAYTSMISAYSHSGKPIMALEVFKHMQLAKKAANEVTLVCLLQVCSSWEVQQLGRSIHAHVMRLGYNSNIYLTSALIDFYCKIGRLEQGEILFQNVQKKDLVCWSSMIKGYGINGRGKVAVRTFCALLEDGYMPNEIVFVSLLSACAHCGLTDEGWKWFYSMEEKFAINPTLQHYTCILDMLGRQGQLEEALEFLNRLSVEPDASLWGVLLSWCRETCADTKVVKIATEQLIKLDPKNSSYYVTLANMYSELGLWSDALRIRGVMEEKGMKKLASYSIF